MAPPSGYKKSVMTKICKRLATGESLRSICKDEKMPREATVRLWIIKDVGGCAKEYTQARDIGIDARVDEILEIAYTVEDGVTLTREPDGSTRIVKGDMLGHRRLKTDTLKWYICKLAPKKYGDRLDLTHKGDSTAPIVISPTDAKL